MINSLQSEIITAHATDKQAYKMIQAQMIMQPFIVRSFALSYLKEDVGTVRQNAVDT